MWCFSQRTSFSLHEGGKNAELNLVTKKKNMNSDINHKRESSLMLMKLFPLRRTSTVNFIISIPGAPRYHLPSNLFSLCGCVVVWLCVWLFCCFVVLLFGVWCLVWLHATRTRCLDVHEVFLRDSNMNSVVGCAPGQDKKQSYASVLHKCMSPPPPGI